MHLTRGRGVPVCVGAIAGIALAGLAACSGPADKAAAPLPGALASLGIDGLAYAKADIPVPGTVALISPTATYRGLGPIRAEELSVKGFHGDAKAWGADAIQAERVSGPFKARRVALPDPSVGNGVAELAGGTHFEGLEAASLGVPFRAARASFAPAPNGGRTYAATGLRATDPATLPAALAPLAGADWDIDLSVRDAAPGRVGIEVRQARSELGDVRASISLVLPDGRDASFLAGMTARDLFDPARWPEGVLLRAVEASGMLVSVPGGLPAEAEIADEGLRRTLAAARASGMPQRWTLSIVPPAPVPMRGLGDAIRRPDVAGSLRLGVAATPVETIAGNRPAGPAPAR